LSTAVGKLGVSRDMFITLEGVEGSGKSTQAELLKEFLQKQGRKVTLTREPGWGALGRLIRRLLLEEKELELHPLAELYLFCAGKGSRVTPFGGALSFLRGSNSACKGFRFTQAKRGWDCDMRQVYRFNNSISGLRKKT